MIMGCKLNYYIFCVLLSKVVTKKMENYKIILKIKIKIKIKINK